MGLKIFEKMRNRREAASKALCAEKVKNFAPQLAGEPEITQLTLVDYFQWFNRDGLKISHVLTFLILAAFSIVVFSFIGDVAYPIYFPIIAIAIIVADLLIAYCASREALHEEPKKILNEAGKICIWKYRVFGFLLAIGIAALLFCSEYSLPEMLALFHLCAIAFSMVLHLFSVKVYNREALEQKNIADLERLECISFTRLLLPDIFIKTALVDCVALLPIFPSCYYAIAFMLVIIIFDAYTPFRKVLIGLFEEWKKLNS